MTVTIKLTEKQEGKVVKSVFEYLRKTIVGGIDDIIFNTVEEGYLGVSGKPDELEVLTVASTVKSAYEILLSGSHFSGKKLCIDESQTKKIYKRILKLLNKKEELITPHNRIGDILREQSNALSDKAEVLSTLRSETLTNYFSCTDPEQQALLSKECAKLLEELSQVQNEIDELEKTYDLWTSNSSEDEDDGEETHILHEGTGKEAAFLSINWQGEEEQVEEEDDEDVDGGEILHFLEDIPLSESESKLLRYVPHEIQNNTKLVPRSLEWCCKGEEYERESKHIADYADEHLSMFDILYKRKLTIYFYAKNYLDEQENQKNDVAEMWNYLNELKKEAEECRQKFDALTRGEHEEYRAQMAEECDKGGVPLELSDAEEASMDEDHNNDALTDGIQMPVCHDEDISKNEEEEGLSEEFEELPHGDIARLNILKMERRRLFEERNNELMDLYNSPHVIDAYIARINTLSSQIELLTRKIEDICYEEEESVQTAEDLSGMLDDEVHIHDIMTHRDPFSFAGRQVLSPFSSYEKKLISVLNLHNTLAEEQGFGYMISLAVVDLPEISEHERNLRILAMTTHTILNRKLFIYYHAAKYCREVSPNEEANNSLMGLAGEIELLTSARIMIENRFMWIKDKDRILPDLMSEICVLEQNRFDDLVLFMKIPDIETRKTVGQKITDILTALKGRWKQLRSIRDTDRGDVWLEMPALTPEEATLLGYVPKWLQRSEHDGFPKDFIYHKKADLSLQETFHDQEEKTLARVCERMLLIYFFAKKRADEAGIGEVEKHAIDMLCAELKKSAIKHITKIKDYESVGVDHHVPVADNQLYLKSMQICAEIDGVCGHLHGKYMTELQELWGNLYRKVHDFAEKIKIIERGLDRETYTDHMYSHQALIMLQDEYDQEIQSILAHAELRSQVFKEDPVVAEHMEIMREKVHTLREQVFGAGMVKKQ